MKLRVDWFGMVYLPTESPNGLKINKPSKGEGGGVGWISLEQQIWFCEVLFVSHLKSIEDILWRSKYWGSLKFEGLDTGFFNDIWRCAAILSKEKQTYYNQEAQSRVQSWEGCYAQICESGGALKKFQISRPPSFLLKTKYVLHKAQNKINERIWGWWE